MSSPIYLLDSNVLIESSKTHYPQDVFSSYWKWIEEQSRGKIIFTVKPCFEELCAGDDGLDEWVKVNLSDDFVLPIDNNDALVNNYRVLQRWSDANTRYNTNAKVLFASNADAWIVAAGMLDVKNHIVVTWEKPHDTIKKRIPIPNVCEEMGVQNIPVVDWLRRLNAKL